MNLVASMNSFIAMDVSKTDTIVVRSVSSTTSNVKKRGINEYLLIIMNYLLNKKIENFIFNLL